MRMAGKFINRLKTEVLLSAGRRAWLFSTFDIAFLRNCAKFEIPAKTMSDPESSRNVEIKARLGSDENYKAAVEIARNLTSTDGEVIKQRDVFFNSREGRLKLRYMSDCNMLIYYARDDEAGPKLSNYYTVKVEDASTLEHVLTTSNGTRGIVQKERLLFIHENTRIHLDKVENLGNFLEFEVVLKPGEKVEQGQEFAEKMMKIFKIREEDLLTGAYLDLLVGKQ
ncbi:uncharacterized protein LOC119657070 [Hermetia illucens]|nr:uncharacterized protein LOC119657070 [Hermetia illucens]